MTEAQTPITEHVNTLEKEIEKIVLSKSIPALPDNVKEITVKLAPWFAAISMFMLLPLILAAFGLSAIALRKIYLTEGTVGPAGILLNPLSLKII